MNIKRALFAAALTAVVMAMMYFMFWLMGQAPWLILGTAVVAGVFAFCYHLLGSEDFPDAD